MKRCPACSAPCLPSQAFCSACGASLSDAAQIVGDPYVGTVLQGRYRILRKLGEGGMGSVYRAEVIDVGHTVAVKLLHDRLVGDDVAIQRFEREAQVASRLNHPNSIAILDFGHTASGASFLVMEYLAGESLADVLHREQVSVRRAVHILRQVLSVLEAAHAMAVVHRDLKPANIFLIQQGESKDHVKVLDFGIARLRRDEGERMTRTGMVCGTPEYMSPEQARGFDLDARSDLYAAGVVFYEMLTGRRPFEGKSPAEIMSAQIADPVIPPSERAPERGIPPSLDAIVLWALAKAPEDRFPSAVEFRRVIESWSAVARPRESGMLELRCPACDQSVSLEAELCPHCGESLVPKSPASDPPLSGPGFYEVHASDIVQDELDIGGPRGSAQTQESLPGHDADTTELNPAQRPAPSDWFAVPLPAQVPFFGHQALLEELERFLIEPGLRRIRISGPPGQGKRRLGQTLLGRLASEGRRGITVQPDPWDVPEPLGAVQRAATALLGMPCEPMNLDDLMEAGSQASLDEGTLYGLADLFNLGKPAGVSVVERRQLRARAWRALVVQVAEDRPTALLFEDFDRMDGASRELVQALAATDCKPSIALMLTHRPEHIALWPPGFREVALGEVEEADLEELALEWSDGELEGELLEETILGSCGNPLHLQQLVAFGRAHPGTQPPKGLADMIAVRASRLPAPLLSMLQAAAVVGDLVDVEMLSDLVPLGVDPKDAVSALVSRTFFTTSAEGVRFVHPYVRQVLYAGIPAGVRAELHRRVADRLEDEAAGRYLRAHHRWHAGDQRDRAVGELIGAGEWALSVLEEEGAVLAFRRSLRLLGPPRAEVTDPDLRGTWLRSLFGLVSALARSGDREEAKLLLRSAVDEAAEAGWHAEAARLEVSTVL